MKQRLDKALVVKGLVETRSAAENLIKLGQVKVAGQAIKKPGFFVADLEKIELVKGERYVSRAGLKLASVAADLSVDFTSKVVLDVGSSTGGFTDFALKHGAKKVIAVDVGTDQMHPSLRGDRRVELREKTDIRGFVPSDTPEVVIIDVSFVSLRQILPGVANLSGPKTQIIAMVKPQFEAGRAQVQKGVIKNKTIRRQILSDFETWAKGLFVVESKADSRVAGEHGNLERFYLLTLKRNSTTSPGRIT